MRHIFTIILAATIPLAASAEPAAELLTEGKFHGDEVTAEAGSTWLALMHTREGFRLKKVTITVETVFDAVLDNDESKPTGKKVTIKDNAPSEYTVFLIRGVEAITEGPVETVFEGSMPMLPGRPIEFKGPVYSYRPRDWTTMTATGTMIDPTHSCCASEDYRLGLQTMTWHSDRENSTKEQVLLSVAEGTWPKTADDSIPEIRWIGDLDRDGVYDYLIDTADHYNVTQLTLHLSSAAPPEKIVAPVAVLRTVGC